MYQFTQEQIDYYLPIMTAAMLNVVGDFENCSLQDLPKDKQEVYKEVFKRLISMIDKPNT